MRHFVIPAVLAMLAGACGQGSGLSAVSGPAPAGTTAVQLDTVNATLGSSFNLRIGQAARVASAGLVVTFRELLEDSRCPIGAQCIQAGNAQIVVSARAADGGTNQATLNLTANAQFPSRATFGGLDVSFQALTPVPRVDTTIARDQYAATLVVTRP